MTGKDQVRRPGGEILSWVLAAGLGFPVRALPEKVGRLRKEMNRVS